MTMIYFGPPVLGFVLGIALGSRIKDKVGDKSMYLVVIITAVLISYILGPFPYYTDIPLATGFLGAITGLIIGKIIFGR